MSYQQPPNWQPPQYPQQPNTQYPPHYPPPPQYYAPQPLPVQPPRQQQQMVKTYRTGLFGYSEGKFARDAQKLAKQGWRVQSQSASGWNWFTRHHASIVVTYIR